MFPTKIKPTSHLPIQHKIFSHLNFILITFQPYFSQTPWRGHWSCYHSAKTHFRWLFFFTINKYKKLVFQFDTIRGNPNNSSELPSVFLGKKWNVRSVREAGLKFVAKSVELLGMFNTLQNCGWGKEGMPIYRALLRSPTKPAHQAIAVFDVDPQENLDESTDETDNTCQCFQQNTAGRPENHANCQSLSSSPDHQSPHVIDEIPIHQFTA